MNTKVKKYLTDQLAFSGLAILNSEHARMIRPDLWVSGTNAHGDFCEALAKLKAFINDRPGCRLFEVRLGGDRRISVIAFSADKLAERITWLTGSKVLGTQLAAPDKAINLQGA